MKSTAVPKIEDKGLEFGNKEVWQAVSYKFVGNKLLLQSWKAPRSLGTKKSNHVRAADLSDPLNIFDIKFYRIFQFENRRLSAKSRCSLAHFLRESSQYRH